MRPVLLTTGLLFFVIGASFVLLTGPAVQSCETVHFPTCSGNQSCPALPVLCSVPLLLLSLLVTLLGGILAGVGALTKSRDQLTDEVLAERP